jgi:NAD(P)H-hydrate epimerase
MDFDAMVLGNGLGLHDETRSFVKSVLEKTTKPVVIDADALKLLSVKDIRASHVLTPHAGEFRILFGEHADVLKDRVKMVSSKAKKTGSTIVLKGPVDVVSNPVHTKLNKTGNPGMTVGGTGDVLAGIIGALAAKADIFEAACAGTFLSGLAGDLCRDRFSYSFTATDVIEKIPEAEAFCKQFE